MVNSQPPPQHCKHKTPLLILSSGGRQYDGAAGSLDMLPAIKDAVGSKLTILFDSGIRTGADIMKALALGAEAVLVGRPFIYGLAVAGEQGAEHVMRCLLAVSKCLREFYVSGL
jgi:lactate 2-monooxygenase